VTVFHRGRHGADLFPEAEHALGIAAATSRRCAARMGRCDRFERLRARRRRPLERARPRPPRLRLGVQRLSGLAGGGRRRGHARVDGGRRLRPEEGRLRAVRGGGDAGPRRQRARGPAGRATRQRLSPALVGEADRRRRTGSRTTSCSRTTSSRGTSCRCGSPRPRAPGPGRSASSAHRPRVCAAGRLRTRSPTPGRGCATAVRRPLPDWHAEVRPRGLTPEGERALLAAV
jgi:hypothetical protein